MGAGEEAETDDAEERGPVDRRLAGRPPGGTPGAVTDVASQPPSEQCPLQFVVPTKFWMIVPVKSLAPGPPRLWVTSNSPLRSAAPGPVFSADWER